MASTTQKQQKEDKQMNDEQTLFALPVPNDLGSIVAVNNGNKWLRGVVRDSVELHNGYITFTCKWGRGIRRFTMATDIVGGYECDG